MIQRFITRNARALFFSISMLSTAPLSAQTIAFTSVPEGYVAGSIDLPRSFGGAMAVDPNNDLILYVSVGNFGDMDVVRVNLFTQSVQLVADGPFGSIAGIAPLSSTQLVLVENDGVAGSGITSETLLLATDFNPPDNDFDDPGEIVELIQPILVDSPFGFSGTQARVAPPGNASAIPEGAVLVQTADGNGLGEILVVDGVLSTPAFRPVGGAFVSGFDFNGGFDFDSLGRIMMGTLEGFSFTGEVFALVNRNGDENIDLGEANRILAGEAGMADLVIDAEDDVFIAGATPSFVAAIRTFAVPADPLIDGAVASTFAETDAGFLSAIAITSKTRPFEPMVRTPGAMLITSGFTADFQPATNLLTLRPVPLNSALGWEEYR